MSSRVQATLAHSAVLRLVRPGQLELADEPVPVPAHDEVLLRVSAVGLCGSDRHWYAHGGIGDALLEVPLVLGHEFAAVIEAGRRAGERVAVDPAANCGRCDPCLSGRANLCTDQRFAGHGATDGALRRHMAWPERCLVPLPDVLSDEEAALLEPLGVALHALDLGHVRPGMVVGVYGCGPIGLLLVQVLNDVGAKVIATDPLAHRRNEAARLGASAVLIASESGEERREIVVLADGKGVDVAFEVAGANAAVETAVETAKPGGRVVLVGIPSDDRTTFTASSARRKGLTIALSRRMQPGDLARAVGLAEAGRVDLSGLITARVALADAATAFTLLAERRGLKVIVQP